MDTITHSLFAIVFNNKKVSLLLLLLFLNIPDILSVPFYFYCSLGAKVPISLNNFLNPSQGFVGCYLNFYRFFHSLTFWLTISIVLVIINKDFWILSLAHLTHIFVDMLTHAGMWGTRVLFPFSDFHIEGVHYTEHPILFLVFPAVIFALYFLKRYIKNNNKEDGKYF